MARGSVNPEQPRPDKVREIAATIQALWDALSGEPIEVRDGDWYPAQSGADLGAGPGPCPPSESGVRRPRRAVRQSLNFISPTTVRRSRSPKICCWMVWLNRLVTFTVVVMAPPCHFTPKLPFTVAYPSV